jgi:hypothetical protein
VKLKPGLLMLRLLTLPAERDRSQREMASGLIAGPGGRREDVGEERSPDGEGQPSRALLHRRS